MPTVTKPYGDFTNNVDVADAVKVNAQLNALYNAINGQLDLTNLASAAYSIVAIANTLAKRDVNGNLTTNALISLIYNQNLLFNPSAHMGLNGWTNIAGPAWTSVFDGFAGGGWFQSPTSVGGVLQVLESVKIPVGAAISITLSGDIESSHLTAGLADIEIQAFNSSDVGVGSATVAATAATLFTKYSCTLTTPANTAYIKIRLATNSASVGYALFRKIKVESGSVATTYSDDNTLNTNQFGSVLGLAQILSGGYKVQSGTGTITVTANVESSTAVTFPTAFTTGTIPIVLAQMSGTNTAGGFKSTSVGASAKSAAGFTAYGNSPTAQILSFDWIAIDT